MSFPTFIFIGSLSVVKLKSLVLCSNFCQTIQESFGDFQLEKSLNLDLSFLEVFNQSSL